MVIVFAEFANRKTNRETSTIDERAKSLYVYEPSILIIYLFTDELRCSVESGDFFFYLALFNNGIILRSVLFYIYLINEDLIASFHSEDVYELSDAISFNAV